MPHEWSIVYAEERQQAIAELVITNGRAAVADLARTYAVTTETVRRDLAALERAGVLRRVHGGAVPVRALHVVEPGVIERESTHTEQKDAIARAAIEFLPISGGTVLLDAGTTTGRVAAALPSNRDLVVVTNSVPIAARLAVAPSVSLQLLGGRVRGLTQAAVGDQVLRVLATLRIDVAFIGTNGISVGHGLSAPDPEEAAVKRAMVASANYVVVVADSSKVGREDFVSFAPIGRVDVLITDGAINAEAKAQLSDHGVEVVIA
jgi:DeoR family transcriptional regulator, fructose operon transcriptional repressor